MITVMRQYMKALQIFLWAVVGSLIVTTFFVWGQGSLTGGGADGSVAVVNGESIPFDRYQRAYQAELNRLNQMYQGRVTPDVAERLGLRQQVVNDLVQEALVVQRAKAEGFAVSDDELNLLIQSIPEFQENGVFSLRRYDEITRRLGLTKAGFEADVRRDLVRRKAQFAVTGGVKVSDAEVEQAFTYRKERVRTAWAVVDAPSLMANTTASDAEIEAHLKENASQFHRPERRKVRYVLIDTKEFIRAVPGAEVEQYYTEHLAEFETPRQMQVAHVLLRVGETGGSEAETRAKTKAEDVIRRAKAGEDFGKLAREFSEDPGTKDKNGEVGWITEGQVIPQFEQVAFALKKDEVSATPVRTQSGYHVIKVLEVKEGGRKPVKEVAPQIRAKLLILNIEKESLARAQQIRPALKAAQDFAAEAKKLGLESRESIISRATGPRGLERSDAIQEAAFSVAIGGVSEPVKTPAGVVIFKVMEQMPAGVPPLADVKDEVATAVKRKKADAIALGQAKKLAAEAKTGDLVALAKKQGLQAGDTPPFSRSEPTDRLPREAVLAALQTRVGTVSEPVKTPGGYSVVKTLERVPPDPADFVKERDQTAMELLEAKRGQAWESWMLGAREKAQIELSGRLTAQK
jgi:peptidyl-prolyl cis-trans isomerase D